jgi:putative spermidine/putrescine transport system permease protein
MMRFATLVGWLLVLVGLVPLLHTIWVSFSPDSFLTPPTRAWSLKWYRSFLQEPRWTIAFARSFVVAILSASVAVVVALCALIGMSHLRPRWAGLWYSLLLLPGCVPAVALGMGLLPLLQSSGLWGTLAGVIVIHATLNLPIVFLILRSLWTEHVSILHAAARGLGATSWQAYRRVTFPLLLRPLIVAFLVAVVLSLNEIIVSIFLATPNTETVSSLTWPQLRFSPTPLVAVVATFTMGVGILAILVVRVCASPNARSVR